MICSLRERIHVCDWRARMFWGWSDEDLRTVQARGRARHTTGAN